MLSAGYETTASMIALKTVALLEQPDAWNRLRDNSDPTFVADVVEELMRDKSHWELSAVDRQCDARYKARFCRSRARPPHQRSR